MSDDVLNGGENGRDMNGTLGFTAQVAGGPNSLRRPPLYYNTGDMRTAWVALQDTNALGNQNQTYEQ
jgi:hypothetical protein